jgi:hypothetical protein
MEQSEGGALCVRQATLAQKLRVSVGTIGRAIKELVDKGLLKLKGSRFAGKYNAYEPVARVQEEEVIAVAPVNAASAAKAADAVATANAAASSAFPPQLIQQIKIVRAAHVSPSEKAKAILDVIAQFLPAAIIDDDNDQHHFILPSKVMLPVPSKLKVQTSTKVQASTVSMSEPEPAATQTSLKAPIRPPLTQKDYIPRPSAPSDAAQERAAMLEKIELLRRKYDSCLEAEAEGFVLEAYEIRRQMCALENKLGAN